MAHVTEKEIKAATTMASRKAGVTRQQLAEKLGIGCGRAKIVIEHAKKNGKWATESLGTGKGNRASVFKATVR